MTRDQELRFKKKCEMELLRKTVKILYNKQHNSDERIVGLKLDLRNKFQMSRSWIDNTMRWLQKKAIEKSKAKKKSLRVKLHNLLEEKRLLSELLLEEEKNKTMNQPAVLNPAKKIIYNNSSKKFTTNQEKLVELG